MSLDTGRADPTSGHLSSPDRTHQPLASGGRWLAVSGPPAAVLLVVVGLGYAVSYLLLAPERRFLVPPPHAVIQVGFLDWDNLRELLAGLLLSAKVAITGLTIAVLLGVSVAVAMSQARWVERSLYPYAVALQTIPILALVPLYRARGLCWDASSTDRLAGAEP